MEVNTYSEKILKTKRSIRTGGNVMDDKNRKRIQLKLSGAEGISYQAYPLTFGVPFKDGDLKKETTVRVVDESGETLPIQTQCLTTWNSDQAFIKWLLVLVL